MTETILRISKILKENLPATHTTSDIDDLYLCEDGTMWINKSDGTILQLGKVKISEEENNGFTLKTDGVYYKEFDNREVLEKFSVDSSRLLFDGNLLKISVSAEENNALEMKSDGVYLAVDSELNIASEHPVQNKVIAQKLNEFNNSLTSGKALIADSLRQQGVDAKDTDSLETLANEVLEIEAGSGGGNATLENLSYVTELEIEDIRSGDEKELATTTITPDSNYSSIYVDAWDCFIKMGSKTMYVYDFAADTWTTYTTTFVGARSILAFYDNKLWCFGGGNTSWSSQNNTIYTMEKDTWTWVKSDETLPISMGSALAVTCPDANNVESIFVYGIASASSNKADVYKYNSTDGWVSVNSSGLACRCPIGVYNNLDRCIYFVFRYTTTNNYKLACYDIVNDTWKEEKTMTYSAQSLNSMNSSIYVKDNKIYYVTSHADGILASYNLETDENKIEVPRTQNYSWTIAYRNDSLYFMYSILPGSKYRVLEYDMVNNMPKTWNNSPFCSNGRAGGVQFNSMIIHDNILYTSHGQIDYSGSTNSSQAKYFYSYDFTNKVWKRLADAPCLIVLSAMVWYEDKIHVIGTFTSPYNQHLTYDPSTNTWETLETLPFKSSHNMKGVIVYNDEIHIFGSYYGTTTLHYSWNGERWLQYNAMPINGYYGIAVEKDSKVHILVPDGNNYKSHYVWNSEDDTYTKLYDLTTGVGNGAVLIHNDYQYYFQYNKLIESMQNDEYEAQVNMPITSTEASYLGKVGFYILDGWTYAIYSDMTGYGINGHCGLVRMRIVNKLKSKVTGNGLYVKNSKTLVNKDTTKDIIL